MSIFISDFDMAKLFFLDQNNPKIFINEPLARFAVSFVSVYHGLFRLLVIWRLWVVVTYESLKTKEEVELCNPKSDHGRL